MKTQDIINALRTTESRSKRGRCWMRQRPRLRSSATAARATPRKSPCCRSGSGGSR